MQARAPLAVSEGLQMLSDTFAPHRAIPDQAVIEIDGKAVRSLLKTIRTLRHMAILQEREIGALRDLELARRLRKALSSEMDQAVEPSSDGNVIRPDFGGKP